MLLIKNGKLHRKDGSIIECCDILIENGIIRQIGADLRADSAETVPAFGLDMWPGIVLPLCAVGAAGFAAGVSGWDFEETTSAVTPEVYIRHSFDLREQRRQRFSRAGITTYGLCPGNKNLIAGQMAFVQSFSDTTAGAFIEDRMAMKANFTGMVRAVHGEGVGPKTHMGMYAMLERQLAQAQSLASGPANMDDEGHSAMVRVARGEIPLIISAFSQSEIESVLQLAHKYSLRPVICGAFGMSERCADDIIKAGWHVCLGDGSSMMAGQEYGLSHERFVRWYRQGMKLSLFCNGDEAYGGGYEELMWVAAAMARAGAKPVEIMDMLTFQGADALGVSDVSGSLEEGKRADIILCNGNPAARFDSFVVRTFIAGNTVYQREEP